MALLAGAWLAVPARASSGTEFLIDRVAAVVNKQAITLGEIYRAMRFDYAPQLKPLSAPDQMKFLKEKESGYLDKMIDVALQVQEAKKQHIKVSGQEIDQAIASIKQKYSLDDKTFESAILAQGMTVDDYRQKLARQMLVSDVVSKEVRAGIHVSGRQVRAYMREKGLWTAGKGASVKLAQIYFPVPKDPSGKAEIEKKADEALKKIRGGEDFMKVARSYSQADPDIGSVKRDLLSSAMRSVLHGMNPGDVSNPFWTDQGLYILKLEDRLSSGRTGEEATEEKAKKEILEADFQKAYKSWLGKLRENSFVITNP